MKCQICGFSIPEEKKFCPGCGRVLTAAELKNISAEQSSSAVTDSTIVYRPASTGKTKKAESTPNIPDIFSSDPNAPEYTDPHTYDRATADILEYDRMFVSRKDESTDSFDDTYEYSAPARKKYSEPAVSTYQDDEETTNYEIEPEYDDDDDDYDSEYSRKSAKPRINIKMLIICIAVIAGLAVIVAGTYQIGKQFGIWGESEPSSKTEEENKTLGEKASVVKEPDSTTASSSVSDYKIGTYTISSDQSTIFMYKSETDDRIIATIPNLEIIEITEISGDMGKTVYGSYTGWVYLEDLIYSPDEELPDKETTTKPETTTENPEDDDANSDETTTQPENSASTGTYTVDLQGDGTYLNVRDSSSTDGTAIGRIDDGAQVTVDKVENGWGHVTTPDGIEGWVYMVYLK